jgi:oxygen-dependent protoporphyrinogen oxidase
MRVAVIGAGPAGVAAADRLDRAGVEPVVIERGAEVGGRTRSVLLGPGHRLDTGAAWLTTGYAEALRLAEGLALLRRDVTGTPEVVVGGERVPAPFDPAALARTHLVPAAEKVRFLRWATGVLRRHPRGTFGPRPTASDRVDAATALRSAVGPAVVDTVFRPAFETMVFAPLEELSADFVESWLRAVLDVGYRVPAEGMDAPWRRIAARLDVRTGVEVTAVEVRDHAVHVEPVGRFDAAVVAVPAPVAARLVAPGTPGRPGWLDDVRHAAHVLAHAVRPHPDPPPASDVHPAGAGPHRIGSVALTPGGDGRIPLGAQGATVSASGPWSSELLGHDPGDRALLERVWAAGRELEPALFDLAEATATTVVRHPHAVPVFGPGHLTRLARWSPRAPVALAGDWACFPCVEGAVRSGRRAADAVLAGAR